MPHESGIPLNNYIDTATRNVLIEFLVGTAETVCSEAFNKLVPDRAKYLAERTFKGFDKPHSVFDVDA